MTRRKGGLRPWRRIPVVVLAGVLMAFVMVQPSTMTANAGSQKGEAGAKELEDFDPKNFDQSTEVNNRWMPLKPGTRYTYEGFTEEEGEKVPHRVVFTVTDLTKEIAGVRVVVVWDQDYSAGKLLESELVFFAQDKEGNVWHFGQYRETFDDVEFVGGRVWLEGMEGGKAGIMMKADPRPGTPSYSQGYAPPPFNWTDRGVVDQVGQKTCVPVKCYEDLLVTAEFSEEEGPDAQQLKYYAPGVGVVRVGWRGKGEKTKETLELVKYEQLTPAALAEARAEALKLETRAYTYGRTRPAEQKLSAKGQ